MTFELRGELDQSLEPQPERRIEGLCQTFCGGQTADNGGRRRTQAPRMRNLVAAHHTQAGCPHPDRFEAALDRANDEVRRVARNVAGTLALDFEPSDHRSVVVTEISS